MKRGRRLISSVFGLPYAELRAQAAAFEGWVQELAYLRGAYGRAQVRLLRGDGCSFFVAALNRLYINNGFCTKQQQTDVELASQRIAEEVDLDVGIGCRWCKAATCRRGPPRQWRN